MCIEWKSIESVLTAKIAAAGSEAFRDLASATALADYPDAPALILHLHGHDGSDTGRDQLLAALVQIAQGRSRKAAFARDILWLAMWPGLTALLRRASAWGIEDEREIVGEITLSFAETVESLDLGRCRRTAASLVRNTQRTLLDWLKTRLTERKLQQPLSNEGDRTILHEATGHSDRTALEAVEAFRAEDPDGADLILACVVEGITTREMAKRCGAEREAVKKRLHRALLRLRSVMSAEDAESAVPDRRQNPHMGMGTEERK